MDADNYYPKRDGQFPELDADRTTSSELLAVHLPKARVIKAFNTIRSQDLATEANTSLPIDEQRAICVAGDDTEANGVDKRVVPFVTQAGKCAMGEKDSIQFFKNLVWDNVTESKTTVESLLVKGDVPKHVKPHVENYNKAVDAAMNCCKE